MTGEGIGAGEDRVARARHVRGAVVCELAVVLARKVLETGVTEMFRLACTDKVGGVESLEGRGVSVGAHG